MTYADKSPLIMMFKIALSIAIFWTLVLFAAFAFVTWTINPGDWSIDMRSLFSSLWIPGLVIAPFAAIEMS